MPESLRRAVNVLLSALVHTDTFALCRYLRLRPCGRKSNATRVRPFSRPRVSTSRTRSLAITYARVERFDTYREPTSLRRSSACHSRRRPRSKTCRQPPTPSRSSWILASVKATGDRRRQAPDAIVCRQIEPSVDHSGSTARCHQDLYAGRLACTCQPWSPSRRIVVRSKNATPSGVGTGYQRIAWTGHIGTSTAGSPPRLEILMSSVSTPLTQRFGTRTRIHRSRSSSHSG